MNEREARSIVREKLEPYRHRSYAQLAEMIGQEPETGEVVGASGEPYQFEIQAFWDSRSGGNVRVLAGIDESPHKPIFWNIPVLRWIPIYSTKVTEDFILSPEGQFVGETGEMENRTSGCN